ncbi:MAG: DUF4340 domain-containing protein [Bacteroidota bacterium]
MKRSTYVLIAVLAILLLVAYLVMQKPGEQSASSGSSGLLAQIDSIAVDKFEVKAPDRSVVLEKKGSEWFVESPMHFRADQGNVASAIHQFKILEGKGIVSSNPDKYSLFQVDSTGTLVKVYEHGAEKLSLVIGKATSTYTDTYVRVANSKDVVLAEGAFGYVLSRPLKDWRDKTILTTPRESIKDVKFQYGDTTFVLGEKDSVWMIGKDSTQLTAVSSLLGSLASVQADDFLDSTLAPKLMAQISFNGNQIRFAFKKEKGKYYVQSGSSPQWYVLESWKATQLLKRKKDLIKSKT